MPLLPVTLALGLTACLSGGAVWAVYSLGLGRPAVAPMIVATAAGVFALSLLGLLPVVLLGPRGVMPTVAGYFVGMFIRLPAALGAYLWVELAGTIPADPVLHTLAPTYVLLLFVEVAFVGRYLWAKDDLPSRTEVPAC
jgi:hypothetical protein